MSRAFSIYLDLIRFLAAALVMFYHANPIYRPDTVLTTLGHEAVVVFFVLSGFVIAYVASTREQTFRSFMVARATRIYSVAIPAIVLTIFADSLGYRLSPDIYPDSYQAWDLPLIRLVSSLLFTNELWGFSIQLFSNTPYWSLNYEVWYYVLFGIAFFVEGRRRIFWFLAVCLFLGPKILLLMPIWWLGVWVYRSPRLQAISPAVAWACVLLSVIGGYLYLSLNIAHLGWEAVRALVGEDIQHTLSFSRRFISDYYLGVVLALHFVGMRALLASQEQAPEMLEKTIRFLAGATFSIYLYHQPLLWFYAGVFSWLGEGIARYVAVLLVTSITIFVLAAFTEQKKEVWKPGIERSLALAERFLRWPLRNAN